MKNVQQIFIRTDNTLSFERLHELGVERHPEYWIGVNCRAAETASKYVDISNPYIKQMVSDITLRIVDGLKVDNIIK